MQTALHPLQIQLAGQPVELLADRALWWPARRMLFIADLHLGKAATYRALGQPVPGGTTLENLSRLDRLINTHQPDELVFLGDFLHAAQAHTAERMRAIGDWRQQHAAIKLTLVRGNHDNRAGDPPASLQINIVNEPHLIGPFAACHHPQRHPTHLVLAGHLHPACTLHGRGRDSLRMPCFVHDEGQLILPAFGEFTGGMRMGAEPGRRLYGVGGESVWLMPG